MNSRLTRTLTTVVMVGCVGATSLTMTRTSAAAAAPTLDWGEVFPADLGNTVNLQQPLIARLGGAAPGSISFQLTDLRDSAVVDFSGASVALDPVSGYAKTPPATLIGGDEYEVALTAANTDGVQSSWSWRFRALDLSVSSAAASIAGSAGTFTGDATHNTWAIVPQLDMGHFMVRTTPIEHSGWGPVVHTVPLQTAHVDYKLNGLPAVERIYPFATGQTIPVYHDVTLLQSRPAQAHYVYGQSVQLKPLTVVLPPGGTDPVLKMDVVQAGTAVPAAACADPTIGAPGCTPDPLRFWVPEDFANMIIEHPQVGGGGGGGVGTPNPPPLPVDTSTVFVDLVQFVCGALDDSVVLGAMYSWHCSGPSPHWNPLNVTDDVDMVPLPVNPPVAAAFVDGVHYDGSFVPIAPQQFTQACLIGYPCVSQRVATVPLTSAGYVCRPTPCPSWVPGGYNNTSVRSQCLFIDGYNRPTDQCKEEQAAILTGIPSGAGTQEIQGGFVSQVGLADDTVNGPWCNCPRPGLGSMRDPAPEEGVGLSWWDSNHKSDVNQKWQFVNDATQGYFVVSDAYYNMNDMPTCTNPHSCPIPPYRSTAVYDSNTGSLSINSAVTTKPLNGSGDANEGWGYAMSVPYVTSNFYHCGTSQFPRGCPETSIQYDNVCGSQFPLVNSLNGLTCADASGDYGHFYGYYDSDVCTADTSNPNYYCDPSQYYQPFNRDGMKRVVHYTVQGDWIGSDSAQDGTVMMSFGHKYEEYDVHWDLGWGVGIFPISGPGFGLSFDPQDNQKEQPTYATVRYCFGESSC